MVGIKQVFDGEAYMTVKLTNNYIEASAVYEVEKIISNTYGSIEYFKFYFGGGKYSKEYRTPTYEYRIVEE